MAEALISGAALLNPSADSAAAGEMAYLQEEVRRLSLIELHPLALSQLEHRDHTDLPGFYKDIIIAVKVVTTDIVLCSSSFRPILRYHIFRCHIRKIT